MDHHNHHHLAQAVDALTASHPHPAHTLTPDELVIAMADLATLAGLLGSARGPNSSATGPLGHRRCAPVPGRTARRSAPPLPQPRLRHIRLHHVTTHRGLTPCPATNGAQLGISPGQPTSHPAANARRSYPDG
jgi:hypothetical protein